MAREPHHPPAPGSMVSPNLLAIESAFSRVPFPISKRELMERIEGETVLWHGRNVDLWELIKDLRDDHFESEEELKAQILDEHGLPGAEDQDRLEPAGPPSRSDWERNGGPGGTRVTRGSRRSPDEA